MESRLPAGFPPEAITQSKPPQDRAYWALVYDLEFAPLTTNRAQLLELGITLPPGSCLSDAEIAVHVWRAIEGLAAWSTYLLHTDHLSDRELYDRLQTIIDEPVREIMPGSGGREFIDLVGSANDADRDIYLRFYASDCERSEFRGKDAAIPAKEKPAFDRDRLLPRPEEESATPPTNTNIPGLPLPVPDGTKEGIT